MLEAILPGRLGPSMPKGNAQLTSRETLSFPTSCRCSVTITARRLAAATQRQVGGDVSTQSCRLGVLDLAPTRPPSPGCRSKRGQLEHPIRWRQSRPQPSPTSGCRSKSAVCCDNGARSALDSPTNGRRQGRSRLMDWPADCTDQTKREYLATSAHIGPRMRSLR